MHPANWADSQHPHDAWKHDLLRTFYRLRTQALHLVNGFNDYHSANRPASSLPCASVSADISLIPNSVHKVNPGFPPSPIRIVDGINQSDIMSWQELSRTPGSPLPKEKRAVFHPGGPVEHSALTDNPLPPVYPCAGCNTRNVLPPCDHTSTSASCPPGTFDNADTTSEAVFTGCRFTSMITSPRCRPALSAGLPG